jgi:hypothetical protein
MDGARVTLLLVGTCTHARSAIDRELHASLEPADDGLPNGVVIISLDRNVQKFDLSDRARANVESGYARHYRLPLSVGELQRWIVRANDARSTKHDTVRNDLPPLPADQECTPTFSPFIARGLR